MNYDNWKAHNLDDERLGHEPQPYTRREKKPLTVKVLVFEIATGEQIREHTCNMLLSEKRLWLYNLIMWANCNHKSVEVFNLRDDKNE